MSHNFCRSSSNGYSMIFNLKFNVMNPYNRFSLVHLCWFTFRKKMWKNFFQILFFILKITQKNVYNNRQKGISEKLPDVCELLRKSVSICESWILVWILLILPDLLRRDTPKGTWLRFETTQKCVQRLLIRSLTAFADIGSFHWGVVLLRQDILCACDNINSNMVK